MDNNIQTLNIEEIQTKILETHQEILELKIQKVTKQNNKTHILKSKKNELAQLLTLETQYQNK